MRREDVPLNRTDWGNLRNLFEGRLVDPGSALSFGLISYRRPHHSGRHADHELIYVLRGKGTARIGPDRVRFRAGTLLVVPRDTDHGIEEVDGGTVVGVVVHFV